MKTLLFLLLPSLFLAQSIIPIDIVAVTGGSYSTDQISLDFSVGEPVAEFLESESISLNQGFQQGEFGILSTSIITIEDYNSVIYPNPATEHLFVKSKEGADIDCYQILDVTGKLMQRVDAESSLESFSIRKLHPGLYILKISSDNQQPQSFTFIKI